MKKELNAAFQFGKHGHVSNITTCVTKQSTFGVYKISSKMQHYFASTK